MTQEELNQRYENRRRQGKKRINIRVSIPEEIKKIRNLERIADRYKHDIYRGSV